MAKPRFEFDTFEQAVRAKDVEILDCIGMNFWEPPDGTYDCVITAKSVRQYTSKKTQETVFGFHLTYLVLAEHPAFGGKEFRSQLYTFTEKGLPWTKGFLTALAQDGAPSDNAEDLLAILNTAVEEQYQVLVSVKNGTYSKDDGTTGTNVTDRILSCGGSTKDLPTTTIEGEPTTIQGEVWEGQAK